MTIAATLRHSLHAHHARFELVPHPLTVCSTDTAQAAHVPGGRLAKGVVLEDDHGYVMAVIPASRHVDLGALRTQIGRRLRVAGEETVAALFADCAPGAVPPVGPAYRMETVVDREVLAQPDLYFEAGDHESLVHMTSVGFLDLLGPARLGTFAIPI